MSTKKEKILQKLDPKFLKLTPKLSGDAGSFINLDLEDSLMSGAKELMIRFFKNHDLCEKSKKNSVQESELTISTAKYNEKDEICELVTERLSLSFGNNNEDDVSEKPGRRLQKLKMELQEKISAKWEEEYRKRINENRVSESKSERKHGKKHGNDDGDEEDDEEEEEEEEGNEEKGNEDDGCVSTHEETSQSKDEEEELEDECLDDGEEADVESDNDDDSDIANDEDKPIINCDNQGNNQEDNLEKDDEYEGCSLIPAYQPGGGMLYGGSELTQENEELPENLLSPSLTFSINESSAPKLNESVNEITPNKSKFSPTEESENLFTTKTKLFSQNPNSFDLNDAFEFCSGKFPDAADNTEMEEGDVNKVNTDSDENEDEEDDCNDDSLEDSQKSENVSQKQISKSKKFQNIIVFNESEDEQDGTLELDEPEETQSVPLKILSDDEDESVEKQKMRKKKMRKSLYFSDEEDASNDCKSIENNQQDEDEGETSSEELEDEEDDQRSVHYDSEENEINPKEFFEKEAELSGSEWSGDEDERGLDEFDVEEGDADCLDNDQVRSQLEKIHIRRVLDDDAREVRLIQEILFEDGDLHSDGKGRDRKFKWKNLGAFEQDNEEAEKEEAGKDSEDEGGEMDELRKIRHEKELFLMTKKKTGELSSDDEIVEDFHSVKVATVKNIVKLPNKSEIKMGSSKSVAYLTEISKNSNISNTRGSFLTRNEEFLSKLAKATSGATDNILGPKNSKNFVFTTKSPEKENSERNVVCKRQVQDPETCGRREKKIKLLPSGINTGPSILDLLV